MAEPTAAATDQRSFLQDAIGLYFSPAEAFSGIVRQGAFRAFVLPLLVVVALGLGFMVVWVGKMDVVEFLRGQAELAGKPFQAPPEQALGFIKAMFWVSGLVFVPILFFVVGAILLFVFRFLMGSEITFKQAMAVVCYSELCVALVATPLVLLVMSMKGDWNIPPQLALQANLSLLFERAATAKPLYTLAEAIDLFWLWRLFLASVGFGAAAKRTAGWAAWGVVGVWAAFLLLRIGLSFVF